MQSNIDKSVYVFDLFGVVISFDDTIVCERIARHCRDPQTAFRGLEDVVSTRRLITGAMTLNELYEDIRSKHGLNQAYDDFLAEWREPYTEPMPGIDNLIESLIPTVIDQNPCAHLRMPRDMIFHGWSMRLFQAWQHSATMSS